MLSDDFIAGFFIGEGYFYHGKIKQKGKEYPVFQLGLHLHERDEDLLEAIVLAVGIGKIRKTISKQGKTSIQWTITNRKDIKAFIDRFKHRFIGYKLKQLMEYEQVLNSYL